MFDELCNKAAGSSNPACEVKKREELFTCSRIAEDMAQHDGAGEWYAAANQATNTNGGALQRHNWYTLATNPAEHLQSCMCSAKISNSLPVHAPTRHFGLVLILYISVVWDLLLCFLFFFYLRGARIAKKGDEEEEEEEEDEEEETKEQKRGKRNNMGKLIFCAIYSHRAPWCTIGDVFPNTSCLPSIRIQFVRMCACPRACAVQPFRENTSCPASVLNDLFEV